MNNCRSAELRIGCLAVVAIILMCLPLLLCVNGCKPDYTRGSRSGKLVQFSEGGLITTTGEGTLHTNDLSLGGAGNAWEFSCRDHAMSQRLEAMVGKNVKLGYSQWWVGPWYQDTPFTVTAIEEQD